MRPIGGQEGPPNTAVHHDDVLISVCNSLRSQEINILEILLSVAFVAVPRTHFRSLLRHNIESDYLSNDENGFA